MPVFDRICVNGHKLLDRLEPVTPPVVPCPECSAATERAWIGSAAGVVDDSIPGGYVMEHVEPGRKVYSQSELRAVLASHGYQQHVEHKTLPGTDRSPHTTKWIAVPIPEHERLAAWHAHEALLQSGKV